MEKVLDVVEEGRVLWHEADEFLEQVVLVGCDLAEGVHFVF